MNENWLNLNLMRLNDLWSISGERDGESSKIFGSNSADNTMNEALKGISRIIEYEAYQVEVLPPVIRELIVKGALFDKHSLGSGPLGFSDKNSIPVNGPLGELSYLSRLETWSGDGLMFHILDSINKKDFVDTTTMVYVHETVFYHGSQWFIFYLDCYHPKHSRALQIDFKFTNKAPQFSGFNKFCPKFPYDFAEAKSSESESSLSFAYIPLSRVMDGLDNGIHIRPEMHESKLAEIKARLSFHLNCWMTKRNNECKMTLKK